MPPTRATLLLTDVVDSTALSESLGDARMAELWAAHDRIARDLLPPHRGREIDKTDGMLLLFEEPADALRYAVAYHRGLADLSARERVRLAARAGLHVGDVILRENDPADVVRGAKPLEVEGLAKPLAARVMSLGGGGQTLVSGDAIAALDAVPDGLKQRLHGHYRLKGVEEPVPLYEVGVPNEAPFLPPEDAAKAYRVVECEGAWVPVTDVPHNLPGTRNAFFGRVAELRELADRLGGGQRLVTLLGPGGTGKSRLSQEFARRWRGDWPGGTWFCELEDVSTEAELVAAVARIAGIKLEGGDTVAWVGALLAEREPTLLLLDNFEQLVQHADVIGRWIALAPATAWVVSSRERLQLDAEHVVRLEALRVPAEGAPVSQILASEAVQLFGTRAHAASARFTLDARSAASVGELVRLLDGMPLAIELAAARVAVMSPAKMVKRMSQRFKLLASNRRGVHRRQATLRGTIDWSWDLIEPWERLALGQCAVFRGGFTLEAAEAVLDLDAWPDAPWPMDVVQGLVDKSLLRTMEAPGGERLDVEEPLLGMYQSIRDYADEKLRDPTAVVGPDGESLTGPDGVRALRERHARHYGGEVEERLAEARTRTGAEALATERENLCVAFDSALALDEPDLAADCWLLLAWLGRTLGPPDPVRERFDRLPLDRVDPDRYIAVIERQLPLCRSAGIIPEQLLQRRLDHWEARGDEERALLALLDQVGARMYVDWKGTRERFAALEERVRASGSKIALGHYLSNSGLAGLADGSVAKFREAMALDLEQGWVATYNLAVLHVGQEQYDEGWSLANALEAEVADDPMEEEIRMFVALLRGQVLTLQERYAEAEPWLHEARERAIQIGNRRFQAGGPTPGLVRLDLHRGDVASARQRVDESLRLQRILGDPYEVAWGLSLDAQVRLAEGDLVGARAAIDEGAALAPDIATTQPHLWVWIRDARAEVAAAEAAAAEG